MGTASRRHRETTRPPTMSPPDQRLYTALGVLAMVMALGLGSTWVATGLVSLAHGSTAVVQPRELMLIAGEHQIAVTMLAVLVFTIASFAVSLAGIWARSGSPLTPPGTQRVRTSKPSCPRTGLGRPRPGRGPR